MQPHVVFPDPQLQHVVQEDSPKTSSRASQEDSFNTTKLVDEEEPELIETTKLAEKAYDRYQKHFSTLLTQ